MVTPSSIDLFSSTSENSLTWHMFLWMLTLGSLVLCLSEPLRRDVPSSYAKTWKDCGAFDTHFHFPWFSSYVPFFVCIYSPRDLERLCCISFLFPAPWPKTPFNFFITCVIWVLCLFRLFRRTSLVLIPWHAKTWKDCGAFDTHFQFPWFSS